MKEIIVKASSIEIISLIDNSIDCLSTIKRNEVKNIKEWVKEKANEKRLEKHFQLPIAEHGFSVFIRVFNKNKPHTILFDVGNSPDGVLINAERMGLNLKEVEYIVLSHGHYDHFGGLQRIVKAINKKDLPIIVHEDMFKTRGVISSDGSIKKYPNFPDEDQVKPAKFIKTKQPYLIAENTILVTGEIPRKTKFEKGFPRHLAFIHGKWRPDPWIWDDRALILNLKHKGLIIVSGCAHSGIINTCLYAQKLTKVKKIHAIIGGFHLAGKEYESRINETIKELKKLKPALIAPAHCTGWRGAFAIAKAMPKAFVWNSVGNLYRF